MSIVLIRYGFTHCSLRPVRNCAVACGIGLVMIFSHPAAVSAQTSDAQEQSANNGEDFTRPENLLQLRNSYTTSPGAERRVSNDTIRLRADRWVALDPAWLLAFRTDLPLVAKNPITPDNPSGSYLQGIGDADFQAAVVHYFNSRWAAGFGTRFYAPTATNGLGNEAWQVLPLAAVRVTLPEIGAGSYFEPLMRYDRSFAAETGAKEISNLQFAPMLNVRLSDKWFATFFPSPDIRINFGDPIAGQTGRLFLPFDALVGCNITQSIVASLEVGVPIIRDYPVYDFKTEARFNFSY